jgi:hypothetical protein
VLEVEAGFPKKFGTEWDTADLIPIASAVNSRS